MDIVIIRDVIPGCVTWPDVARMVKSNLNPRKIEDVPNAVGRKEIITYFESVGLGEQAKEITRYLEDMAFIECKGAAACRSGCGTDLMMQFKI